MESDNNKELLYKKSKIQYYDPLYTTFNTVNIGKNLKILQKLKIICIQIKTRNHFVIY